MKKNLLFFLLSVLLGTAGRISATPILIHYWHFNNIDTGVHVNNLVADYSTIGGAKIVNVAVPGAGADTGYVDSYAPGDTLLNVRMSADPVGGPHYGMRLRNPNDSMECRWYIPSAGYKNLMLKFVTQKSNNGPSTQNFQYSTDSGSTWKTTGLSMTSYQPTTAWTLVTINMNSATDTLIKNNPKLVFRITLGTPNTGTSGNNRFDNITVEGDTLTTTAVNEIAATTVQYSLYPNPANTNIVISGEATGNKAIAIYNAVGQLVYNTKDSSKNVNIDITSLSAGTYYAVVTDNKGSQLAKLQFVKK
ncbi:MAG: T9SS type A sorting domain-containing protein [Bacteroidetes bacterium]|nr:T9SS type A sorting domain-containing protein [Bacteroidota bacterium]